MENQQNKHTAKTVLMLGCFDSKTEDFNYLHSCLAKMGVNILSLNTGVFETNAAFSIDITAAETALQAGISLSELRSKNDRGLVVEKMGQGAFQIISELIAEQKIDAAIGMGGGGGTYIALSAMQAIPIGMPKVCLSTVATKDLSRQVGTKDIVLVPSIVDVAGLNKISSILIAQSAAALVGMVNAPQVESQTAKGTIAISMFGNTTACVQECTRLLKEQGYEVLAFHAVGSGGKAMESLIHEGFFDGVLDLTTTELADDLCEGICSAGPDRLTAAASMGIPQVVAPGCLDMVNYGHLDTVPSRFQARQLYSWAPDVTLMRTNEEENRTLGTSLAHKLNAAKDQVALLLPLKGISIVSSEGGVFHAPDTDQILFNTIKTELRSDIPVVELDVDINDPAFAEMAVNLLLKMLSEPLTPKA
ncbi:MAG: Tm-1-like ATP-binding domain-containing protein [Saprospiraceae bacterium]|nr:Tm-1-like ATP-binding domain-containing protein [Saprospiraceae bacterium]